MIAFEVSLNRKRYCIAGKQDLHVLSAIISAVGRLGKKAIERRENAPTEIHLSVGGLIGCQDPAKNVHLNWKSLTALKIGDVVQIKIVEASKADRPVKRKLPSRKRPNK